MRNDSTSCVSTSAPLAASRPSSPPIRPFFPYILIPHSRHCAAYITLEGSHEHAATFANLTATGSPGARRVVRRDFLPSSPGDFSVVRYTMPTRTPRTETRRYNRPTSSHRKHTLSHSFPHLWAFIQRALPQPPTLSALAGRLTFHSRASIQSFSVTLANFSCTENPRPHDCDTQRLRARYANARCTSPQKLFPKDFPRSREFDGARCSRSSPASSGYDGPGCVTALL